MVDQSLAFNRATAVSAVPLPMQARARNAMNMSISNEDQERWKRVNAFQAEELRKLLDVSQGVPPDDGDKGQKKTPNP